MPPWLHHLECLEQYCAVVLNDPTWNNIIYIHSRLKLRVPIRSLPRESRALFILHGVELPGTGTKQNKTIISWVSLNLFNSNGFVIRS